MTDGALVTAILAELLDSFDKLEVVLALSIAPCAELALRGQLVSDDALSVTEALDGLLAAGILARGDDGLALADGPWLPHCQAVARLAAADRAEVVHLMTLAALARAEAKAAGLRRPLRRPLTER